MTSKSNMTRRTWFRTITGAFATLATGLGLRKVEKVENNDPWNMTMKHYVQWREAYARAYYESGRWHFEDVKPEEE